VEDTTSKVQLLGEIVAAISNIAHQTNRLALDAAIQAAMAGENGKGFSAVAADIRRLAERAKEETSIVTRIVRSIREDIGAIEEVKNGFPFRENDQIGMITSGVLIHLADNLNEEQVKWLTSQKDKGKISDWYVLPTSAMTGASGFSNTGTTTISKDYEQDTKGQDQVSGQVDSTKQLRLTIELIPDPLQGVSLYNILRKSGKSSDWKKLREQVIAQQNARCGICQVENVTLICHEIWWYDDMSHIRALTGLIAICKMCDHCKHMGLTKILASEGKLNFNKVIEHFMSINQCSHEEYIEHQSQAWKTQTERNKHKWTTDFGEYAHLLPPP